MRLHPPTVLGAFLGIAHVGTGVYTNVTIGEELARSREASAVVIELVYETGTMQKARAHPVVRYTTADGVEVVGRTEKHRKLKPGERVQIVYDPAVPERIEIGTLAQAQRQRWVLSGTVIGVGLALVFGTLLVAVRRRAQSPPE